MAAVAQHLVYMRCVCFVVAAHTQYDIDYRAH